MHMHIGMCEATGRVTAMLRRRAQAVTLGASRAAAAGSAPALPPAECPSPAAAAQRSIRREDSRDGANGAGTGRAEEAAAAPKPAAAATEAVVCKAQLADARAEQSVALFCLCASLREAERRRWRAAKPGQSPQAGLRWAVSGGTLCHRGPHFGSPSLPQPSTVARPC